MQHVFFVAVLVLAGAFDEHATHGSAVASVGAIARTSEACAMPEITVAESGARLTADIIKTTKANFTVAYERSCRTGVLKSRKLHDPGAVDVGQIFLFNAPEANTASIYLSKANGNRMVLEYPFLTADGRSATPSTKEIEEAIYCKVVGATAEEQESAGRCLPD